MKNFNGRHFFSLFFVARANQKIPNLALGRESTPTSRKAFKFFYRLDRPALLIDLVVSASVASYSQYLTRNTSRNETAFPLAYIICTRWVVVVLNK
jgi:hypothetical protein